MGEKWRPIVLSIAGFDPSGGAGILADIKTFENIGVYGVTVITAPTVQSHSEFVKMYWRTINHIVEEIDFLIHSYPLSFAKIGIIRDIDMLEEITRVLQKQKIKIIWDTVLESSTSKTIFKRQQIPLIKSYLKNIFCITPNFYEALLISNKSNLLEAGTYLSQFTNVIIKGGHNNDEIGTDYLFLQNSKEPIQIPPQSDLTIYPKHGSGCVFSSALTAYLALGNDLNNAAINAKKYTEKYLTSSKTLIGYHSTLL